MEVRLAAFARGSAAAEEAESLLRSCVHCGFCNASCPTYQLLGDERDGPRGRIYLLRELLEGRGDSTRTLSHFDRCLTCRACESACPSGVQYGRLIEIGREISEQRARPWAQRRLLRPLLRALLRNRYAFAALLWLARCLAPLLPRRLAARIPRRVAAGHRPRVRHVRRMLLLAGCVQPAMAPRINAACTRVMDRLGVSLLQAPQAGCCGALDLHLGASEAARQCAKRNIDAWWPQIENGAEAIISSASACTLMLKDYGRLLADDEAYAARAARVAAMARDISEALIAENRRPVAGPGTARRVAFQVPCSLQHGQKLDGEVGRLLAAAGFELLEVRESQLCCGSAGSYSLLQPALSRELRERKLKALLEPKPECIVTANIGCLAHLAAGSATPVRHWIELLDPEGM